MLQLARMSERNLCHEAGCPDLCCINKWSRFSPQEIKDLFPNAIQQAWDEEVGWLDEGVHVLGDKGLDGNQLVFIKGRCPNNINGCAVTYKPEICRSHPFAGEKCNDFRRKERLLDIQTIPVESITVDQ